MSAKQVAKSSALSDAELEEQLDAVLAEIQRQFPDLEQVAATMSKPQPSAKEEAETESGSLETQASVQPAEESPEASDELEGSIETIQSLLAMAEEDAPAAVGEPATEKPGFAVQAAEAVLEESTSTSEKESTTDSALTVEPPRVIETAPSAVEDSVSALSAGEAAAAPENLDQAIQQLDADLARQAEASLNDQVFEAVDPEQIVAPEQVSRPVPLVSGSETATAQDVARELDEQTSPVEASPVASPPAAAPVPQPATETPSEPVSATPPAESQTACPSPPSPSASADHAPAALSLFGGALVAGRKARASTSVPPQPRPRYRSLHRLLVWLNQPFVDVPASVRLAAGVIGLTNLVIGTLMIIWALIALVLR